MAQQITITCVQPGGGAVLVDHGRKGKRSLGVAQSGAADRRVANRLQEILQLEPTAVLLELPLSGGQWLLSGRGQIAIGGAEMNWKLNGRPAEAYTTIDLDGDYLLDGGFAQRGCRAYLAIRGEWQTERWLGSVSPGLAEVPTIESGWAVTVNTLEELPYFSDLDPCQHCPELPLNLNVIPGPEWFFFTSEQQSELLVANYTIGGDSNRQGLRLLTDKGKKIAADNVSATLKSEASTSATLTNMISSPVLPGTI